MADAREVPKPDEAGAHVQQSAGAVFKCVKDAVAAVERGEPCLHLDLSRQATRDWQDMATASKPFTKEELVELAEAVPKLTQLQSLRITCACGNAWSRFAL